MEAGTGAGMKHSESCPFAIYGEPAVCTCAPRVSTFDGEPIWLTPVNDPRLPKELPEDVILVVTHEMMKFASASVRGYVEHCYSVLYAELKKRQEEA